MNEISNTQNEVRAHRNHQRIQASGSGGSEASSYFAPRTHQRRQVLFLQHDQLDISESRDRTGGRR